MLKKRLFSSPAAFAITLQQHEKSSHSARRRGDAGTSGPGLQRQLNRADEDHYDDDEAEQANAEEPSEDVKKTLTRLWHRLEGSLRLAIERRMRDRTDGIRKQLEERREKEATDITAILTELTEQIEAELSSPDLAQLELFTTPEREQFERNVDWLKARVRAIPGEIAEEVEAIRTRFTDPNPRVFPVAVTLLLPARGART
jgi:cell division protein ZapA (FtsZ GTPase activity inhibitor)